MALGLKLGADVPVFIRGQSAFAEGIGEQLTPVTVPEYWYLVITPNAHVNTATIYQHEDLTRDTPPIRVSDATVLKAKNDFEPLVRQLYPEVEHAFNLLDNLHCPSIEPPMLSGSGACVFIAFACERTANLALAEIGVRAKGFVARGTNNSPTPPGIEVNTDSRVVKSIGQIKY